MTGPISLIRKKSQKLKRRLSKQDKSSNSSGSIVDMSNDPYFQLNRHHSLRASQTNISNIRSEYVDMHSPTYSSTPRYNHSVSFDLSPSERDNFSFNSPIYMSNHPSRSNQNLLNYKEKENFNTNLFYKNTNSSHSRRSIDNLGELIKIPRKRSGSPIHVDSSNSSSTLNLPSSYANQKGNRKSFDIGSFQLSKTRPSSKRIVSDSSLYSSSTSRPTSMIIDHDSSFIPPYNIHNSTTNNINTTNNNTVNNSKPINANSLYANRLTQSALSLNTIANTGIMTLDHDTIIKNPRIAKFDPKQNQHIFISNSTNLQRSQSANFGTHHNHKHKHNSHTSHSHHSHHKSNSKKSHRTNQGVISTDIDRWSTPETTLNIIFAIIFHTLNIFFSLCIYLPIYMFVRMGSLSYIVIASAFFVWYFYMGNSPSDSTQLATSTASVVLAEL